MGIAIQIAQWKRFSEIPLLDRPRSLAVAIVYGDAIVGI